MKERRTLLITLTGILAALCFLILFLITAVEAIAYWTPGYYEQEYEKYEVLDDLPEMTMEDLLTVTDEMMDYLRGDRDDLHVYTTMDGEEREFFNEREIAHMEDVRALFIGAIRLRWICLMYVAAWLTVIYVLHSREKAIAKQFAGNKAGSGKAAKTRKSNANIPGSRFPAEASHPFDSENAASVVAPRALCLGTVLFFAVFLMVGGLISTDFSKYFVVFHHIFFDNDLWILDPSTDMLINIVPEGFFSDTALLVGVTTLCMTVLFFLICLFMWLRSKVRIERGPQERTPLF